MWLTKTRELVKSQYKWMRHQLSAHQLLSQSIPCLNGLRDGSNLIHLTTCQPEHAWTSKSSTFWVIFPCLQQERIASSDFQGLKKAAMNFSRCVIYVCFTGDFDTCIPYNVKKKQQSHHYNYILFNFRTMQNTQVNINSVISMHFSAVSFLYTKCLNDDFVSGSRPSWLEWGWSPANHRPQSGPFDLPETMVRTNSSAAQLLVFFYVFLSSVR